MTCPSADQADQHFIEWTRYFWVNSEKYSDQDGGGSIVYQFQVSEEELFPSQTSLTLRHSRIHPFRACRAFSDWYNIYQFLYILFHTTNDRFWLLRAITRAAAEPGSPPRRVFMIISSLRPFDDGRMDRGTGSGTTDDFNSILFY